MRSDAFGEPVFVSTTNPALLLITTTSGFPDSVPYFPFRTKRFCPSVNTSLPPFSCSAAVLRSMAEWSITHASMSKLLGALAVW